MAKDPAVLFYTSDFLVGTETFSFSDKGRYIHLLCVQHQTGHMTTEYVLKITDSPSSPIWAKFKKDDQGLWFNERMDEEKEKRIKYSESRRANISKRYQSTYEDTHESHMKPHMENENVNDNKDNKKGIVKGKSANGYFTFGEVWEQYPKKLGRKAAEKHFKATVNTQENFEDIQKALNNFLGSKMAKGDPQYIPHGSTWFNNWRDWVDYKEKAKGGGTPRVDKPFVYEEIPVSEEEQQKISDLVKTTLEGMGANK